MGKVLKSVGIALLLSLVSGLLIGTWLRMRLDRPTVILGATPARLAPDALPLDVGLPGPLVRDARHHEQEIG